MAVPTFSTVAPLVGHTAGRSVVEIRGTNFRTPTIDEVPIAVFFGSQRATNVRVVSDTRLFALTPIHDAGLPALRLVNLDAEGAEISGEEVIVSPGPYEFRLPRLTSEHEAELMSAVRALLQEMKRQIVKSVAVSTDSDYEGPDGIKVHATELPSLPGIALVGPNLTENRFYSQNEPQDLDVPENPDEEWFQRRPPYTVDLIFDVFGFADNKMELINLQQAATHFFKMNPTLRVPCGDELQEYEMDLTPDGDFQVISSPNNSNLRAFSGQMIVRGFDLFLAPSFDADTQTMHRGASTDDQGAEITVAQMQPVEPLVVRSIVSN